MMRWIPSRGTISGYWPISLLGVKFWKVNGFQKENEGKWNHKQVLGYTCGSDFKQKQGTDYFDTCASVARISTIRLLFALAPIHKLIIHQINVKADFFNGNLKEVVYIKQPEGFVVPG